VARAQALFALGGLALFQGDFAAGRAPTEAALALYRALDDPLGVARTLTHLALCGSGEDRHREACARIGEAIRMFRDAGDARRLSAALNNRGTFERELGELDAALADHDEAFALQQRAGDRDGAIVTRLNLALVASRLGRDADASAHVGEALALVGELGARRSGAAALEVAADVLARRGRAGRAACLSGAARALRARIALEPGAGWRRVLDDLDARVREAVTTTELDEQRALGAARPFDDAVRDAQAWLADTTPACEGMEEVRHGNR